MPIVEGKIGPIHAKDLRFFLGDDNTIRFGRLAHEGVEAYAGLLLVYPWQHAKVWQDWLRIASTIQGTLAVLDLSCEFARELQTLFDVALHHARTCRND